MMFLLFVTVVSVLIATAMSAVAWRVVREERRRSEARVASLATEIHSAHFRSERDLELGSEYGDAEPVATASDGLFATIQPAPAGSRFATVLAFGVIVVGSIATVALLSSSGSRGTTPAAHRAASENRANAASHDDIAAPVNPLPLELVALGHDRDGDRLTVRGVVRNPSSGAAVQRLTAVVFLFNRDGGFLGSGRATVESPALAPGGESTFVVTVPGAAEVGRYRVSFRTEDRVVPHVDRREHMLARS